MNEALQRTSLLMGATVLLAVLTFWNVGGLFSSVEETVDNEQPVTRPFVQDHLPASLKSPFFGLYAPLLSDESIEHSRLSYVIVGILFSPDSKQSQVVLRAEDGVEKVYRVGDPLGMRVSIQAIEPHRIVLSNQGNWESLSLPENALRFEYPHKPLMMKE